MQSIKLLARDRRTILLWQKELAAESMTFFAEHLVLCSVL